MEAANVALIPLAAFAAVRLLGGSVSPALVVSALAASALLVIGTLYLRALHQVSLRKSEPLAFWVPILARLQIPSALLATAAVAVTAFEVATAASRWSPEQGIAIALSVLAVLEYVNYYHVQLQHFDHAADFKRLMTGKGFRTSQLARDIARWRRDRPS